MTTAAQDNARKVRSLLERGVCDGRPWADLYRTVTIGTASGRMHADVLVGSVWWQEFGPEFRVRDEQGEWSGTVTRVHKGWEAYDSISELNRGFVGIFPTVSQAVAALNGVRVP